MYLHCFYFPLSFMFSFKCNPLCCSGQECRKDWLSPVGLGEAESAFKHSLQFEDQIFFFFKPGLFSDDKALTLWDAACSVR